ncbi:MAG: sigma-70 family RNA polymerase sigma factor [Nitriliruptoraceae bacterium]
MDETFRVLLRRASHGEETAWNTLFHTYAPSLIGFLRGAGAPEPDDQLSEVFLQIARDLHTFHGDEANFRAWIFTIARNRMLDALRWQNRRPVSQSDFVSWARTEQLADFSSSEFADAVAAGTDLYRLLERLNANERDILVLRFVADLDTATVGAIVGKRANTVAAISRRALHKLRIALPPS